MLDRVKTLLDEVYTIDKFTATAKQHCDEWQVPYDVFKWRKSKGRSGKELFKTPIRLVYFGGEFNTLEMLAEKTGIPEDIIQARYQNGLRGQKLTQDHKPLTEDGRAERMKLECRAHLRALIRAHPDRAATALRHKMYGDSEDWSDPAVGLINAQRFEDAARGHLVESTGYTWSSMV